MVNGILEGDPVAFVKGGCGVALGIGILDLLTTGYIHDIILESAQEFWEQNVNNTNNST